MGDTNFGIFMGYDCAPTVYVYNNTVYNCRNGFVVDGFNSNNPDFIAKNNLAQNCLTYGYWRRAGGTFNSVLSDYNISDRSAETNGISPSYQEGVALTVIFAGSDDCHLSVADTIARDQGQNLSGDSQLAFFTDIDGQTRPLGLQWDIGADEASLFTPTASPTPTNTPAPFLTATATPVIRTPTPTSTSALIPVSHSAITIKQNIVQPQSGKFLYIDVRLNQTQKVNITIYTRRGQRVKTLVDREMLAGTSETLLWDGRDKKGEIVGTGIYILHITGEQFKEKKKVAVIR